MTETPASELTDFLNNPGKIIPLREPIGHGTWTDGISLPYGRCSDCLAIGNDSTLERGKILLYDLVQLAEILGEDHLELGFHGVGVKLDIRKELAATEPYVEITACDHHLRRAAEECFIGNFQYHETGKDALHTFARPQTLLWIELYSPQGITRVMASYPVHPGIAAQTKFLERNFEDALVKERFGGEFKER